MTAGPFEGWTTWSQGQDPFETHVGPFYFRVLADGSAISAFEPRRHHLNGSGAIHGGVLLSFADFALFSIAHNALGGDITAVTLTLNSEFASAGDLDGNVEARGEVVRETGSLVFARGILSQKERPLLVFSGTLRKLRKLA
jgi:acyl-coenzyme A thioesterase PaaI-like protein